MADFPVKGAPAGRRRQVPFLVPLDTRMRELANGAWEVGGEMSESQIREERIRDAAYFLWIDAGRPTGRDVEFWLAAEKADAMDADVEADTASEDSFPASDPPANTGITGP
jgi:hypothetical protein